MTMPDEYDRPEYRTPRVMLCTECHEWALHDAPDPVCLKCMNRRRTEESEGCQSHTA